MVVFTTTARRDYRRTESFKEDSKVYFYSALSVQRQSMIVSDSTVSSYCFPQHICCTSSTARCFVIHLRKLIFDVRISSLSKSLYLVDLNRKCEWEIKAFHNMIDVSILCSIVFFFLVHSSVIVGCCCPLPAPSKVQRFLLDSHMFSRLLEKSSFP